MPELFTPLPFHTAWQQSSVQQREKFLRRRDFSLGWAAHEWTELGEELQNAFKVASIKQTLGLSGVTE